MQLCHTVFSYMYDSNSAKAHVPSVRIFQESHEGLNFLMTVHTLFFNGHNKNVFLKDYTGGLMLQ